MFPVSPFEYYTYENLNICGINYNYGSVQRYLIVLFKNNVLFKNKKSVLEMSDRLDIKIFHCI